MAERRHVSEFPFPNASADQLERWLNTLPGRLFLAGPKPDNAFVWMAITVEEVEK